MALYVLGALLVDVMPFNATDFSRSASADFAFKDVMEGLAQPEFMGEGQDVITLTCKLYPFKRGGLDELGLAYQMLKSGQKFPVMRGDGQRLGTYVLTKLGEKHKELIDNGVGFEITVTLTMRKVPDEQADNKAVVSALSDLFKVLT